MNRALVTLAALACAMGLPVSAADLPAYRHGGGDMNPGGPEAERLENVALPPLIQDMRADLTRQAARVAQVFEGRRVSVVPFTDARPGDRRQFGWNDQHGLPVTTREDLGAWVAAQLADALRTGGVEVVEAGGELRLSGSLVEAMVRQGSKLVGSVRLELAVADATGRELWRGKEMGWAVNRGRYSLPNFVETPRTTWAPGSWSSSRRSSARRASRWCPREATSTSGWRSAPPPSTRTSGPSER